MRNARLIFSAIIALAVAGITGIASATPAPQRHPAYLRALSDLRDARAHLQRPNGGRLERQEQDAVAEIDAAIREIKAASIDDGKNIDDHAPIDPHMPWGGRLHTALDLLDRAHNDVDRAEEDPAARGLKHRALDHIDKAHHHVEEAIALVH